MQPKSCRRNHPCHVANYLLSAIIGVEVGCSSSSSTKCRTVRERSSSEAAVGVGVGDDVAPLLHGRDDGDLGLGCELPVLAQADGGVVKVLVDDANHAVLAVRADLLWAVVPDRLGVLDDNLENLGCLALLSGKVKSGEERAAVGQRLAWLAKAGLRDGVVLGEVVPLDHIADLGDNVVWIEAKATEASDNRVRDASERDSLGDFPGDGGGGCSGHAGGQGQDGKGKGVHVGCR